MRILQVDKFLHRQGGAPAYMLDLAALQRQAGHEVEFFAMADERNAPATYAEHFVPNLTLSPFPSGAGPKVRTLAHLVWSRDAKRRIGEVLDLFQPQVVHVHNVYHQLSPSVLWAARSRDIPVVMTVHDAKLVCPTYLLQDNGGLCQACVGSSNFSPALSRKCRSGSLPATGALVIESTVHRLTKAYRPVGTFICPSRFHQELLRRSGVFPERLQYLPHPIDAGSLAPRSGPGEGFVYVGRLDATKGVDLLVRAAVRLGVPLTVVGDGPDRPNLEALAATGSEPGLVTFTGALGRDDVLAQLRRARAAVLPTRLYENAPLSILEAFAVGVPVIATRLGGIPDLVDDGVEGLLVAPDALEPLVEAIDRLQRNSDLAQAMGQAGRKRVETNHDPVAHVAAIDAIYEQLNQQQLTGTRR